MSCGQNAESSFYMVLLPAIMKLLLKLMCESSVVHEQFKVQGSYFLTSGQTTNMLYVFIVNVMFPSVQHGMAGRPHPPLLYKSPTLKVPLVI